MPWVLDLDGVVWLGDRPIPGAAEAVALVRATGDEVVFVTNNSWSRVADQEAKLAHFGIPADGAVMTSAQAAAVSVEPGERVLVVGGPGLREEVARRGVDLVDAGPCDAVVSGVDLDFDYGVLRAASRAIRAGARWILTNDDPTYPTPTGLDPGSGAMAAAIRTASGGTPVVAGKPEGTVVALVRDRLGDRGHVVGDQPDTDGKLAAALGYDFGLVLSGVTGPGDLPLDPAPWRVADDLLDLVRSAL